MDNILKFPVVQHHVEAANDHTSTAELGPRTTLQLHIIQGLLNEYLTGSRNLPDSFLSRLRDDRDDLISARIQNLNTRANARVESLTPNEMLSVCELLRFAANDRGEREVEKLKNHVINRFKVKTLEQIRRDEFGEVMVFLFDLRNQAAAR